MTSPPSILVVDDDPAHRTMLTTLLGGWQHRVTAVDDGSTAIDAVHESPFDLVLMDIRMLKVSGIEALAEIKAFNPAIPVILMTAYSSVETAVDALKKGAYDYLTKPLDFDHLRLTMARALEHTRLKEENRRLKASLGETFDTRNIIGHSRGIKTLLETVEQVAASETTALIVGESGTGKELIASALHYNSPRKENPFVKINCAAITETLLESELFGHEKGSFTGADRRKNGRFQQAHGGSLFLDEVSEMSVVMQAKLLRALQEKEITRVGGEEVIRVDVRVIAATNKDLLERIEDGTFREDLYYRLNVINLKIPPLRERGEDIPLLAGHFLEVCAQRNKKVIKGFTPAAMDAIVRHQWPGNVRELSNAVESAVVLTRSDHVDVENLPGHLRPVDPVDSRPPVFRDMPLEAVEKMAILNTIESAGGNKSEAARRLGITRKTLHKKLKSYGVD